MYLFRDEIILIQSLFKIFHVIHLNSYLNDIIGDRMSVGLADGAI